MNHSKRSTAAPYFIPVAAVGVAAACRLIADRYLAWEAPWAFFALAILVSARYGGRSPGIVATLLSGLIGVLLFNGARPGLHNGLTGLLNLTMLIAAGSAISMICGHLRATLQDSVRERLRFERIVAAAPGVIFRYDLRPDGSAAMPFVSAAIRDIFGLEPGDVVSDASAAVNLIHPDDRPSNRAAILESKRSSSIWHATFRVNHPGKGEIWVEGRSAPNLEPDGTVSWYGFLLDVTEKHRAEELAKERTRLELDVLRSLVERAPIGIVLLDRRLVHIQASDRWLGDNSLDRESVLGKHLYECVPNLPEEWKERHRRGLAGETLTGFEDSWVAPGGDEHWVTWRISPWGDAQGETGGIIIYAEDVTERRRLQVTAERREREIEAMNATLELRVKQRTAQLEAANNELESFAYSVSHDLRAPLRGIDGWSMALLEEYSPQLDDRARGYLNRVRSETQRMGQLIDDLLKLSRVARADMEQTPVDLSAMAGRVANSLVESLPRNGSTPKNVEFVIEPGLRICGDPQLLEIALTNLFDNAIKFTSREPAPRVEFGGAQRNGRPSFYVADNGVGFDPRHAGSLFGAFQRLHKPSDFPGTGVGLATVKRVVHRHGGEVWAEGEPGKARLLDSP